MTYLGAQKVSEFRLLNKIIEFRLLSTENKKYTQKFKKQQLIISQIWVVEVYQGSAWIS